MSGATSTTLLPGEAVILQSDADRNATRVVSKLAASAPEPKSLIWNLKGSDASTTGNRNTHFQVPFDCTITGWEVANPDAVNATTTLDFRRTTDANYPGTWDGSPLTASPVGLSSAQRNSGDGGDFSTAALNAGDWVRVEIATADSSLTSLVVVLKVSVP